MLRSLILSSCVFLASNVLAHDDHDHHEHEALGQEEATRTYIPVSCKDLSEAPSEQCVKDMEIVKWIHQFLRHLDHHVSINNMDERIVLKDDQYEGFIEFIRCTLGRSNPSLASFEGKVGLCKQTFDGFLKKSLSTSSIFGGSHPDLVETFCKSLSAPHSHSHSHGPISWLPNYSLVNILGAGAFVVFTSVFIQTGDIKAAAIATMSLGLASVCTCNGQITIGPCAHKLAAVMAFFGAIGGWRGVQRQHELAHQH